MKHVDEYRDAALARGIVDDIARTATKPSVFMEICGGQTHTILRYGLDTLLPAGIELVHGPGCPVCVTAVETVDQAIAISLEPGVIFVSYGDMLRVPGSQSDLFGARARGADVRVVYSPVEALKLARAHPERRVVFFGIGFETTAPAHALTVRTAREEGLRNFCMLVSHVLVPPAVRVVLQGSSVEGLIAPGHVCAVMGYWQYEEIAREFGLPVVVGGFEPVDLLQAVRMLVLQRERGDARVENAYVRAVTREGNVAAQRLLEEVFEITDRQWRGMGAIPASGLRLRDEYADYDAERVFGFGAAPVAETQECAGADVLRGKKKPSDCAAFGIACTPEHPLGAPMVSNEGSCAAYYRYRRGAGAA